MSLDFTQLSISQYFWHILSRETMCQIIRIFLLEAVTCPPVTVAPE
jgi:hypothetical protein